MSKRTLLLLSFVGLFFALTFAVASPSRADDCTLIYEGGCFELELAQIQIASYVVKRHNRSTGCLEFWETWIITRKVPPFDFDPLRTSDPNLVQYRNQHSPFLIGEVWEWDFDAAVQNGDVTVFSEVKLYERCNPAMGGPDEDKPEREIPKWDPIPPYKIDKLMTIEAENPVYVHLIEVEGIESNELLPDGMGASFLIADKGDVEMIFDQLGVKR